MEVSIHIGFRHYGKKTISVIVDIESKLDNSIPLQ